MEILTCTALAAIEIGSAIAISSAAIGCALIIIGAGYGISKIGERAVESLARQPEASGNIFSTMIVSVAFIEGVTFFALLICFLCLFWSK
jgi:F-type H+-transporting ATPase subunit c